VVGHAAPVPYRPRKALPPRTQALIDAQLRPMRRRDHPDWLEKPFVRKMTLLERQQLVSARTHTCEIIPSAHFGHGALRIRLLTRFSSFCLLFSLSQLTAQHQKWDLEKLNRQLRKTKNPFASLQYIDRAHESVPQRTHDDTRCSLSPLHCVNVMNNNFY
jgi:hypothetical protein